ncbi:MAG: bicyclomycin resistance protein [Rubrivivax sp.]|nr:bicyclomycin resistance protein [Rubrivivax sp.]
MSHGAGRREVLAGLGGLAAALALPPAAAQHGPGARRVLRYAFPIAETSFDPAQITDVYSRMVAAAIFEGLYEYEYLARPARVRPATAAAMPEIEDDFRRFTFRVQPGIHFADDPAFGGVPRELTAGDFVYALKRHYDPRWKSGALYLLENARILGLSELRREALGQRRPFDYERPVEGLRTLDRYTFQVRLAEPQPRFAANFVGGSIFGAVAREVVERYGDKVGEHPVGTGPFRLAEWRRSSRIVLERNPGYREVLYDERPPEDDGALRATAERFRGRRLPLVDRVELSIVAEPQPRWLAFLNGEMDLIENLPAEFVTIATPNNRLAPHLVKRGIRMARYPRADLSMSYFAMEHPLVGGYAPAQVALRRAISLAIDVEREIQIARRGQAIPAQGVIPPGSFGHDGRKTEMSDFSRARAKALLDLHGYVDRDGDGWREQPDGRPLLLEYATQPDQRSRQLVELWQKNMAAVGLRIVFSTAQWPENLKASRAGRLMMWGVGWSAGSPDGDTFLALGYGPNKGQANHARFDLPAFNALYERQRALPDGPEREAVMAAASRLLVAYMPYKAHVHTVFTDLAHPWVDGYHASHFRGQWWKYVDVAPAAH